MTGVTQLTSEVSELRRPLNWPFLCFGTKAGQSMKAAIVEAREAIESALAADAETDASEIATAESESTASEDAES